MILNENASNIVPSKTELQRIQSFGFATELIKYIVDTFDLVKYYHISNETNNEYKEIASQQLKNHYHY